VALSSRYRSLMTHCVSRVPRPWHASAEKVRYPGLDDAEDGQEMDAPYQDEEGLWLKSRKEQPHTTSRYLGRWREPSGLTRTCKC
jgi:hypothetical protein